MKRLFALINSQGKSKEQLKNELWEAYLKYQEAEKKAEDELIVDVTAEEEAKGTAYIIMGIPPPKDK